MAKSRQNHQHSPADHVKPQSLDLIQKIMINVCLDSFLFGYMLAYFNSIDFDKIMVILQLDIQRSLGQGLLTSCLSFNAGIGALASSLFLKSFTRKNCFHAMNILCIIATFLIQTKEFYLIFAGRFLQGIFVGINSTVAPLYIKQFIPQMNAKYGIYHQIFIMLGVLSGFALNLILLFIFSEPQNYWRLHFSIPIFVCLFQMYQTYTKYNFQTPRYLVAQGRYQQAKHLLQMIYKQQYAEIEFEILKLAVTKNLSMQTIIKQQQKLQIQLSQSQRKSKNYEQQISKQQIRQQLLLNYKKVDQIQSHQHQQLQDEKKQCEVQNNIDSGNKLSIFAAMHISIFQQAIGLSIIISYSKDICLMIKPQINNVFPICVHIVGAISVCLVIFVAKAYGRVAMLQFGGTIISICLFVISYNFFMGDQKNVFMILAAIIVMRGTFSFSLGPIVWLYMAEIVKPHIYPYGAMLNWLTFGSMALLFPIVTAKFGHPGYIFIFSAIYTLISVIINYFCLVQTKNKNQLMIRKQYSERFEWIKERWRKICG